MELYDYGDNVELVRSFAPATVLLTTSFSGGPTEEHRIWRELLRGTGGLILWDARQEFVADDGTLGQRGREAAPWFAEFGSGLGALLGASERQLDPVAILYSQSSRHVQWMLDHLPEDGAWVRLNSSNEYDDNPIRAATRTYLRGLEHRGIEPVFIPARAVSGGALEKRDIRVLLLPGTIALSSATADEIRSFAKHGGLVLADGEPGVFDEHGRRMARPLLADLFPRPPAPMDAAALAARLAAAGVRPAFPVALASGEAASDVETYVFHNGNATILALLRDLPAQGSIPAPEPVVVELPHSTYAYDVRRHAQLGSRDRLDLSLAPFSPSIIALSDAPLPPPTMRLRWQDKGSLAIDLTAATADDVLHVAVEDATGLALPALARNVRVSHGAAHIVLALADAGQNGPWTISARDVLSGLEITARTDAIPH